MVSVVLESTNMESNLSTSNNSEMQTVSNVLSKEEADANDKRYNKISDLWCYLHKAEQLVVNDPEFYNLWILLNLEMDKVTTVLNKLEETYVVED